MVSAAKPIDVLITVEETRLGQIDRIADECRKKGLGSLQVLKSIGTITGAIDAGRIDDLKAVRGVLNVERGAEYHLPPPDADVQ